MKKQLTLLVMAFYFPCLLASCSASAQDENKKLTPADYARAERMMSDSLNDLVMNHINSSGWTPDNRFWYNKNISGGHRFFVFDPEAGTTKPLFDHDKLADALSDIENKKYEPDQLPMRRLQFSKDGKSVLFSQYRYHLNTSELTVTENERRRPAAALSPDEKKELFIRDHNLWLRRTDMEKEEKLTEDGMKD